MYDITVKEVFKSDKVIIFRWSATGVGFGELTIDAKTHDIIDDEFMNKEFCDQVIKIGLEMKITEVDDIFEDLETVKNYQSWDCYDDDYSEMNENELKAYSNVERELRLGKLYAELAELRNEQIGIAIDKNKLSFADRGDLVRQDSSICKKIKELENGK